MAEDFLTKDYGLIYSDKDGKDFLYKSYFTLDDIFKTFKTDEAWKKLEKTAVKIVHTIDQRAYIADINIDIVVGGLDADTN